MSAAAAVRAEQLQRDWSTALSFAAERGSVCKLVLPSRDRKIEVLAMLAGLAPPARGRLWLLGAELYALDRTQRIGLFRRIGVVPEDGGLITNLKAWENILLPSLFHHGKSAADVEPRVVQLLQELYPGTGDLRAFMGKLPDRLTLLEKRLVALVRTFLLEPEIVIYDFLLAGVDRDSGVRLVEATERFHAERAGRVSLYLCTDNPAYGRIRADQTIELPH
jgi:phospholipid/cholesterol/gamma-HCH transport system ATP-binding protein